MTTQGPFYVRPTWTTIPGWISIAIEDTDLPLALVPPLKDGKPNYEDAAMMSASWNMQDTLIAIQERLMTSKEPVDLEEINAMISLCFEKIHAEADV